MEDVNSYLRESILNECMLIIIHNGSRAKMYGFKKNCMGL